MNYRRLGKTGLEVSEVSLGTWQVGGRWGEPFDSATAERIIEKAIDGGVNFIDTADVYGDRLSEATVGRVVKRHLARGQRIHVATKCGRFINPHVDANYSTAALRGYVEASLENLGLDTLDLIQLHCPPEATYARAEIFGLFDDLKREGKISNLGVSVETIDQALQAIQYPNVTTIQVIFNMFRSRPSEVFFGEAHRKDVGIIARVPLASGLLSGRYTSHTEFGKGDHRTFNREGAAFDKGETFSGVDYATGLRAVEDLKALFPAGTDLASWALRWVLMFPEVSTVIPGASRVDQVASNLAAAAVRPLTSHEMAGVADVYARVVKPGVHHLW